MLVAQRPASLLGDIVRAILGLGQTLKSAMPAEPAPYWTDYLRDTRETRH